MTALRKEGSKGQGSVIVMPAHRCEKVGIRIGTERSGNLIVAYAASTNGISRPLCEEGVAIFRGR